MSLNHPTEKGRGTVKAIKDAATRIAEIRMPENLSDDTQKWSDFSGYVKERFDSLAEVAPDMETETDDVRRARERLKDTLGNILTEVREYQEQGMLARLVRLSLITRGADNIAALRQKLDGALALFSSEVTTTAGVNAASSSDSVLDRARTGPQASDPLHNAPHPVSPLAVRQAMSTDPPCTDGMNKEVLTTNCDGIESGETIKAMEALQASAGTARLPPPYSRSTSSTFESAPSSGSSDAYNADLARVFSSLSLGLSHAGSREAALNAAEEAVKLRRELARKQPDVFIPDLARALRDLSRCLSSNGKGEAALTALDEAIKLERELATMELDLHNVGKS